MTQSLDDLMTVYKTRGLAGRVGWGRRPALLVVDLTNGFTDPALPLGSDLSDVIAATNRLLGVAREAGFPVIFMSIAYHDPEAEGGWWAHKVPSLKTLRHGTAAVEVDARLGRRPDEPVVYKWFGSSFAGTGLQAMLQHRLADTLVVCGTSTSGCIRATVMDGVQQGFRCIVPEEAVGDRGAEPHRANLFDIDAKYGDVEPLETVLANLERLRGRVRAEAAA